MFIKSAAMETDQGKAIQKINEKWGQGRWNGTETIGISVCKKKYAPFSFKIVRKPKSGNEISVKVERMFGCQCHSQLRKSVIEKHGCRKGWEPFGQWSLRKAMEKAKVETDRLNAEEQQTETLFESTTASSSIATRGESDDKKEEEVVLANVIYKDNFAWKVRSKFDNVRTELVGEDSDSEYVYERVF